MYDNIEKQDYVLCGNCFRIDFTEKWKSTCEQILRIE